MIEVLLVVGVAVLGVAVGWTLGRARSVAEREPVAQESPPDHLDPQVLAVLGALRSATVVVELPSVKVVRAGADARNVGLVRGERLAHPVLEETVAGAAAEGRSQDAELELRRGPVGSGTVVLQVRVVPLGHWHVLVLAEDRTDAQRVEAIRRDFVVNVSHELKTPVGALSLLAETVEDAAEDPQAVRRFAGRIRTEAQRLSALVHEIIELSRLQVTDPLQDAVPVDVGTVVGEAVDRAQTAAHRKQIVLEAGAGLGATVLGSRDLLVTAVRNLLDNAVAYSESGTRVAVGTTLRPEEGLVEIAVVDQGIGIPLEVQSRLFERFFRVDPARSRDTGGTGLGLSIVKHVAADHGGEVTVWSRPGHGSTFTIRLPLAPEASAAGVPTTERVRKSSR